MSFDPSQIAMMAAPLDPKHVAERAQSGRKLSYIEGWHAIAEANRIFGYGLWDRETVELRCVSERERKIGSAQKDGFGVSYIARVRITVKTPAGDHVAREGVGNGHGIDADPGLAHESACKEAETDAMKRALMTFGNPFGLALYDKTQANVGVDTSPPEGWSQWALDFTGVVDRCETPEAILTHWNRHAARLKELHTAAPEIHKSVVAACAARKATLSTPEQKAA